ncbi:serine/threonine-protein kinase brsk2-like protein [Anaeramoeba ignava]|uniref:Serine/threonine-protein kinase brsk2-like protein n=1 Tax=Anaeramoeba ignava TaxID=1746090 RepID=A0A9Q0LEP9_ANAIG|nr:serine/threonine-protein kinase brsk2-like protein [Anaeramoeba ignava]
MSQQIGSYTIIKTIGEGATGKVKLAIDIKSKKQVAIKMISKTKVLKTERMRTKAEREIAVLKLLNHPNVIKVIDVLESNESLFVVMEYMQTGELFEYLIRKEYISLGQSLCFFQQLIYGVEYCHNHLICHRDLKPENLLLDEFENLKIADFGMAGLLDVKQMFETSCGSPHYAAPEVIIGNSYDGRKSDIWSCGVILFVLTVGRLPFEGDNIKRVLMLVKRGLYQIPDDVAPDIKDLINKMLQVDPEKRITISEIKKHPWFCSNFTDNFIPPESILRRKFYKPIEPKKIDSDIVKQLANLGWEKDIITQNLTNESQNLEKILYTFVTRKIKKTSKINQKSNSKHTRKLDLENSHKNALLLFEKKQTQVHNIEKMEKANIEFKLPKKTQKIHENEQEIQKPSKTKRLFGNLFRRRKRTASRKYVQLKYDEKFITNGILEIENEKQHLVKNHYVSLISKKSLMEIISTSQQIFDHLQFRWNYPNIFTLKAKKSELKIKLKILACQIYKQKSSIEIRLICKQGEAAEFIVFCNQFANLAKL